jgi:hypothetical protein
VKLKHPSISTSIIHVFVGAGDGAGVGDDVSGVGGTAGGRVGGGVGGTTGGRVGGGVGGTTGGGLSSCWGDNNE